MSATLTLNLDFDVLRLAEREAQARHTTLPEVVAHQLRVMARNWQDSQAGRTPLTDALHGAVKLPADFDERVYPAAEASYGVRHQDMLYTRTVAGSSRPELLLVSTETTDSDEVTVVHSVGIPLDPSDLEIT